MLPQTTVFGARERKKAMWALQGMQEEPGSSFFKVTFRDSPSLQARDQDLKPGIKFAPRDQNLG